MVLKDIPAVVGIHKAAVAEINSRVYPQDVIKEWLAEISKENVKNQFSKSTWVVAEIEGELVGFGQYSIGEGEVYQIDVLPRFEGKGCGRAIYEYIEDDFVEHSISRIKLNSTLNAADFYKKLGFQVTGKTEFALGSGAVEMVTMEKELNFH